MCGMTPIEALDEAIRVADGVTALADRIGVRQSVVSMWRTRMKHQGEGAAVPAEYCPAIERETGVKCEYLNPRADWPVLRVA